MTNRTVRVLVVLEVVWITAIGAGAGQGVLEEVYGRATNQLQSAVLFKPGGTNEEQLGFKLAPLIFQEAAAGPATPRESDKFGRLSETNGVLAVDREHAAIYVQANTATLNSRPHPQLTYYWFYAADAHESKGGPAVPQAIRLTLDSAGEPAIWELFADRSGLDLIFVSQKLESASSAEFGRALPGRRHAVERGTNETPRTVVARVIDDGPVPMGPIVYLREGVQSALTVSCRCMPVQVKTLSAAKTYELFPWEDDPRWLTALEAFGDWHTRNLEQLLRLPKF